MLALISLLLVLIGCANWLTIGLLQFDFVAGLFGSQSSIFSRIIYVIVGVAAIVLTVNIIKNKGKIAFNFKKIKMEKTPKLATQESGEDFSRNREDNHHESYEEKSLKFSNENVKNMESSRDNARDFKGISQELRERHNINKDLNRK